MRTRLLAAAAALVLAVAGLVVPASPASAHCSGHGTHPDRYHDREISYANGTFIRRQPHMACGKLGQGFPGQSHDVHCAVFTGSLWFFIRNTSTGINGWSRVDALRYEDKDDNGLVIIRDCVDPNNRIHFFPI